MLCTRMVNMKKWILIISVFALFLSCENTKDSSAQDVVDKSIAISGGAIIANATLSFNFRDKYYKATRNNGIFQLERRFKDSLNTVRDLLSNNGFERFINNKLTEITPTEVKRYSTAVNSVHYFSVLPFGLNDKAVNKEYLKKVDLKGKPYHKIKITFNKEGGGEDFEDVFVYWINTEDYKTEYLAYSFKEKQGIGLRFRAAYNERYIKGVRVVDYYNYKPKDHNISLLDLGELFENNQLELLSKIDLKNVEIEPLK